jgi:non-specific serine/threonine protein kinase
MDITVKLIEEAASPGVVSRGRAYFHDGRVHLDDVSETFVRAVVEGSDEYIVELHQKNNRIVSSCTCPYDGEPNCKHVIATMLATMYHQAKVTPLRSPARSRRNKKEIGWVKQVEKILPERIRPPTQAMQQKPWRLAYGLSIAGQSRSLYPLRIKLKQDGSDGAATLLKQYDVYDGVHFDLTDRILLPRLEFGLRNTVEEPGFANHVDLQWYSSMSANSTLNDKRMADVLALLEHKELHLAEAGRLQGKRLTVVHEAAHLALHVDEADGTLLLQPIIHFEGKSLPLPPESVVLTSDPLWVLHGGKIFRVHGATGAEFAALLNSPMPLAIPERDREEFLDEMLPRIVTRYRIYSSIPSFTTIDTQPRPRLYIKEVDERLAVELRFLYDTVELPEYNPPTDGSTQSSVEFVSANGRTCHVARKFDAEAEISRKLFASSLSAVLYPSSGILYLPTIHPLEWLRTVLPVLRAGGFEVFGQQDLKKHRLRAERPTVGLHISSGIDWFDLGVEVKVEDVDTDFAEFVKAIRNNERFVKLGDGSFGMLEEEWVRKFRRTLAIAGKSDESLRLSRTHLGIVDELLRAADEVDTDAVFDEMRERFRTFTNIRPQPLPVHFNGELRPYQKAGYDWLHFLAEFGVGGILADDMGLGKTVQALALLQKVYEDGAQLPSLIVVPASPLFNWLKEIERFTPTLRALVYTGSSRKQTLPALSSYHLVVTSYGIMRRDIEFLKKQEFQYVILDESQNIKNPVSVTALCARALNARRKLALSGTPVENNLSELWSQFAFLNPGMLGSERMFTENFARPIERFQDESASAVLKQLISPFILRRTKELVAKELPPKVESTVYCDMDTEQRRAYEHWRRYYRETIRQSIEEIGFQRSKIKVLEGLMRLRQVCCHPAIIDKEYKGSSGKFDAFTGMLDDILAEGHKVLVFSQFVTMLTVLRHHCDTQGIVYEYLDGRTTNRQERVERFQSDENVKLFLISLKAGGTGLNLTAADYVIHYDPWWNPAVEMQATDRTHRIGQTKHVFAYKLITRESVEEKILALQERKRALVQSIITTDSGFMKSLTKEDVEALFS